MKKEMNPIAVVGIILVVVVVAVFFGYKVLQPAPYQPSPGAYGTAGMPSGMAGPTPGKPAQGKQQTTDASVYYPSAPAGSVPGKPLASGH